VACIREFGLEVDVGICILQCMCIGNRMASSAHHLSRFFRYHYPRHDEYSLTGHRSAVCYVWLDYPKYPVASVVEGYLAMDPKPG
jgi:hypothetical protein